MTGSNLVQNGRFTVGSNNPFSYDPWVINRIINLGDSNRVELGGIDNFPFYRAGIEYTTLSQTINTIIGKRYILSYYLQNTGGGPNQYFATSINNISIPNSIISLQSNGVTPLEPYDFYLYPSNWIDYSFYFIATSVKTVLSFTTKHDTSLYPYPPPVDVYFNLTNISIILDDSFDIKVSGNYISMYKRNESKIYQVLNNGNIILYASKFDKIGGILESIGVYVSNTKLGNIIYINNNNRTFKIGELDDVGSIAGDKTENIFYTTRNSRNLNDIYIYYNINGLKRKILKDQPLNIQIFYFNRYLKIVNKDTNNIIIYNIVLLPNFNILANIKYNINTIHENIICAINVNNTMLLYLDNNTIYTLNNNKLNPLNIKLISTYIAIILINYKLYGVTFDNTTQTLATTFLMSIYNL